jgi:hypothetical protein
MIFHPNNAIKEKKAPKNSMGKRWETTELLDQILSVQARTSAAEETLTQSLLRFERKK